MFPVNLLTISGLSILLHGVISLPDATSYDNNSYTKLEVIQPKNVKDRAWKLIFYMNQGQ